MPTKTDEKKGQVERVPTLSQRKKIITEETFM